MLKLPSRLLGVAAGAALAIGLVSPAIGASASSARSPTVTYRVSGVEAVRFDPKTHAALYRASVIYSPRGKHSWSRTTRVSRPDGTVVSQATATVSSISGSMADPAPTPLLPRCVSGHHCGGSGCCSASGGWNVHYWASTSNYTWNTYSTFCWGGGTPGVHWGYVFNCGYSPGNGALPATGSNFTKIAFGDRNPRVSAVNDYFFGWSAMNYSQNTGYNIYQQGTIDACMVACYYSHYPSTQAHEFANGWFTWDMWDGGGY